MLIAIDICNCLADVDAELQKILGPKPDNTVYYHPRLTPKFFEEYPEVFKNALPIPGSVEGADWLNKNFQIMYLTARPPASQEITKEWLVKNGYPAAPIIFSTDKVAVTQALGVRCAIEDDPAQITGLSKVVQVLIHSRPYNRHLSGTRFNWQAPEWKYIVKNIEIVEMVKEVKLRQAQQYKVQAFSSLQ